MIFHTVCGLGDCGVRPSGSDLPGVLRRCRLGDESAWGEFHAWVDIIARWSLAAFNGLGRADRQDIVATAIERLIPVVRGDRIRGTTGLEIKAYVARAIRNIALNIIRSRRDYGDIESEPGKVEATQEDRAQGRALLRIVEQWPPADRFLFIQKMNGVSSERIKAELEQTPYKVFIALSTVDTRYHKMRARLREQFEGMPGTERPSGS
jgi:DNA-directed RNA polymerase specialized sigma24 family protein